MIEVIKIKEDKGKLCTVGEIFNQCFYKRVKLSKHLYVTLDAWGIDSQVFNTIVTVECRRIKILDVESGQIYECNVQDYQNYAKYLHFKPHRAQVFLSRKFFKLINNPKPNEQRN